MEEWKKLIPLAEGDLDICDGGDDASGRMTNKLTGELGIKIRKGEE